MSAVRIGLSLELRRGLHAMVDRNRLNRVLREEARAELERLGLPCATKISLGTGDGARAIRIRLNGTLVPYPPDLLVRVWQGVAPRGYAPASVGRGPDGGFPDAWLHEALDSLEESERTTALVRALAALTTALMRRRPERLLTPRLVAVYVGEVEAAVPAALGRGVAWGGILRPLVRLTGTLADRRAVGEAVLAAIDVGLTGDDVVESAFAELRDGSLEVTWGSGPPDWSGDARKDLEGKLFERLGLPVPEIRIVHAGDADRMRMEVRTAGVPAVTTAMIGSRELLVEGRPELGGVDATTMMHPLTGAAATVVAADARKEVERAGVAFIDARQLAIRVLARELNEQRGRLLTISEVEHQLALLRARAPAVVGAAVATFPLAELTRIARLLVEDGISMGDLKGFLDRLLDYEASRPRRPPALEEPPVPTSNGAQRNAPGAQDYAEAVRRALGHAVPATDGAVSVITVDPQVEARLASASRGERELLAQRVRDAAWLVCGGLPEDAQPVVVTSPSARRAVRAALADELPSLAVRTDTELSPALERRLVGEIAV